MSYGRSIVCTQSEFSTACDIMLVIMRWVHSVFYFDLFRVFLQGATMPLHPRYFLSVPSTVWHSAVYGCDSESVFCFDLSRVFLQAATMPLLHPRFFFYFSWVWKRDKARAHYAPVWTCLCYCFKVAPCPHYTLEKSKLFWSSPWKRDSYSQHE